MLLQLAIYPGAICDETGNPNEGTKASWTDKLRKGYKSTHPPVVYCVLDTLPKG